MTLHGIDISHYQSGLDLAGTGVGFAIMKATEGTSYVDPKCDAFYQAARKAGILRGVYHFYRGGGAAEADWFLKNVAGYVGDALLALDFEDHTSDVAGAHAFLDRVRDHTDVAPVLYTSRSVLTEQNLSGIAADDYGLWLARWGVSDPGSVSPWTHLALWQYADDIRVPGWTGNVDGDVFYGDAAAWAAYAGLPAPAPAPAPDQLVVDGEWGTATTTRLQEFLGTAVDGVVSEQDATWRDRNPGLGSGWQWRAAGTADGSQLILAMQRRLGSRYAGAHDGLAGPEFFKGCQRFFGTPVDGVVSEHSSMVIAMQRALNAA